MRKSVNQVEKPSVNPLITEPNQFFTPRQIIEQFARGELTAKTFTPTDNLSEENFTEDELLDKPIISFEDEFDAKTFMEDLRLEPIKACSNETDKDKQVASDGTNESSDSAE